MMSTYRCDGEWYLLWLFKSVYEYIISVRCAYHTLCRRRWLTDYQTRKGWDFGGFVRNPIRGGLKTTRTTVVAFFLPRPIHTHSSFCRNTPLPRLVATRETFYLIQLIFRPFLLADYIVIRLLYYNIDLWVSVCMYVLSSTKLLLPSNDLWRWYIYATLMVVLTNVRWNKKKKQYQNKQTE